MSRPQLKRDPLGRSVANPGTDRQQAKVLAQAEIDAASLAFERGQIPPAEWCERTTHALSVAYLLEDDPRWQSGFDGDAQLWREARELILEPIAAEGTFLDVGCATGHLMECLAEWGRERGVALSMFGLDMSRDLVAVARARLPAWRDRIFEGNALDWIPPQRFRYVRTGLEYAPRGMRARLVERLLAEIVDPDGRLIAGPVTGEELAATIDHFREAGVARPRVAEATDHKGKTRHVVWCEAPATGGDAAA